MAGTEQVFLDLTVLLTVAVATHFVIKRFGQPTIIGEIAIGVVLGPSILGFVLNGFQPLDPNCFIANPPTTLRCPSIVDRDVVAIFAALGSIFLLFLIGLDTDVRAVYKKKNILVAVGGVVLPWVLGFLTAVFMVPESSLVVGGAPINRFVMATFVGATLVATSTAIAAAVLKELGMMRHEVASTIMGAVIIDDVLGLLVLSISLGVAGGNVDVLLLAYLLAISVAFIVLAIYLGTRHFGPLVVATQARGLKVGLTHAGFMIAMAVAFMMSFLAEAIGLSAVIGAFLAGAMFSRTPLKADFEEGVSFLGALFTPIFFISLGMLVNVWRLTAELLAFGLVLTLVAIVTKLVGCAFPARLMGMSRTESLAVGYGMIPRGEVGLIIAVVAFQAGVIGGGLFSIIVLVIVLVSVFPAPLLRNALLRLPKPTQPSEAGGEPEPELY